MGHPKLGVEGGDKSYVVESVLGVWRRHGRGLTGVGRGIVDEVGNVAITSVESEHLSCAWEGGRQMKVLMSGEAAGSVLPAISRQR